MIEMKPFSRKTASRTNLIVRFGREAAPVTPPPSAWWLLAAPFVLISVVALVAIILALGLLYGVAKAVDAIGTRFKARDTPTPTETQ